eukprot:CAMPEP_0173469622 /NCGR_PEP_ID=MMETSP1357-20121228/77458_1 /TAXON_ID=77926 /ORGANISM="Hemiselmis rufescens, Strain PCC563" /LENGTH=201 /DNA_ID=CAMNT_0014437869 /DNA_START=150 /DNA_END=755 /DNA_ORIENTATION=+
MTHPFKATFPGTDCKQNKGKAPLVHAVPSTRHVVGEDPPRQRNLRSAFSASSYIYIYIGFVIYIYIYNPSRQPSAGHVVGENLPRRRRDRGVARLDGELVGQGGGRRLEPDHAVDVAEADVEAAGAAEVRWVRVDALHDAKVHALQALLDLGGNDGPGALEDLGDFVGGAADLAPNAEVLVLGALHGREELADGEGKLRLR